MACKILVVTSVRLPSTVPNSSWQEESTKRIDHDNSSDRKWLATHCFWALRNDRKVTTYPLD